MATGTPTSSRADEIVTQFRQYDQGVHDFIRGGAPLRQDGKPVHIVFATPDRAFAAMQLLLQEDLGDLVKDLRNIPLPFVSLSRTGRMQFDFERFHGAQALMSKLGTSPDASLTYNAQFPLPYDFDYQIEFWAKNRETLNAYELWVAMQFRTGGFETFIPIDFRNVWNSWGTKSIPFENEGITDNSDLEPQEGHRVLRFTQGMTAKGWILLPLEEVKAVFEIFVDTYIVPTEIDLAVTTAAQVDADPQTFDQISRVTIDEDGSTTQNF